ncbi:hypothetical protein FEK30_00855 (plasmid) [Picosynechococcus sp. PCC 11901]|uniref:hypothetical protein n=1 Tax=Picosynechococcus sp. PCC 11901 TaxID=2579791 RepID=UPI0010FC1CA2|nr:hypothetical protein [Picosynechococcus sp. PCC 11901]QCS48103.1 hypothetical protein FEK30_00855 [Picosynechococcus sp. PCC 11901]
MNKPNAKAMAQELIKLRNYIEQHYSRTWNVEQALGKPGTTRLYKLLNKQKKFYWKTKYYDYHHNPQTQRPSSIGEWTLKQTIETLSRPIPDAS